MTELTETSDIWNQNGWVLYDGECSMCIQLAGRFAALLRRYHFDLAPLQSPWVRKRLSSLACEPLDEMFVLSPSREVYVGADGVVFLMKHIWWAWPFYGITRLPGAMWALGLLYRWVARNRTYFGGRCIQTQERKSGGRKEPES